MSAADERLVDGLIAGFRETYGEEPTAVQLFYWADVARDTHLLCNRILSSVEAEEVLALSHVLRRRARSLVSRDTGSHGWRPYSERLKGAAR